MPPKLRIFEYNYSTHQRIPQSYHKTSTRYYTNIQHLFKSTCGPHTNTNFRTSSRGIRLVQGFHYLVGHQESFFQMLIELFFRTISFGSLPKYVQPSGRPVRFYQPEYMTHVLTGGCGDIAFKGFGYFTKFSHQRERFVFVSLLASWLLPSPSTASWLLPSPGLNPP